MKLKVENFRCYANKSFDFGKNHMTLISGTSGLGKSSIMQAIYFVLYGQGTKVVTTGKKSCMVEFEFNEWKVTRKKGPNRLLLENTKTSQVYEDAEAQGVINEYFGFAFDVVSYIDQNAVNSFIRKKPTERLYFLEQFAFRGIDLPTIKKKCQSLISSRNKDILSISSKLEAYHDQLNDMEKPTKLDFPLGKTSKANRDKKIKNEEVKLKNAQIRIKKLSRFAKNYREQLADLRVLNTNLKHLKEQLNTHTEKIEALEEEKEELNYEGDEKLQEYRKRLQRLLSEQEYYLTKEKYEQDKGRLDEMIESERKGIAKEIFEIETRMWDGDYKNDKDVFQAIKIQKELIKDLKEKNKLLYRMKQLKITEIEDEGQLQTDKELLEEMTMKLEKLKLQQDLYSCPNCETVLRFRENRLEEFDDADEDILEKEDTETMEEEILELRTKINDTEYTLRENEVNSKKLKKLKEELETIETGWAEPLPSDVDHEEETLENMRQYRRSQQDLKKRIEKLQQRLEENDFSNTIQTFQSSLNKQKEKLKELRKKMKGNTEKIKEEELREKIHTCRVAKNRFEKIEEELKRSQLKVSILTKEIEEHNDEYKEKHKYTSLKEEELQHRIQKKEEELEKQEEELQLRQENLAKIEEFNRNEEEIQKYKELENKVKKLEQEEKEMRDKYAGSTLLKEKILRAESIAMENVISSINAHAQEYLDEFFPDVPISVSLRSFKERKNNTNKPEIHVSIEYKGQSWDLGMLSGGEFSRVVLAFTLALSEIFNTPLILLDECTASLDQELTGTVIHGIRKNSSNKTVLMVAHQVVTGLFDNEIHLK